MRTQVVASVSAFMGGTLNWAVITTGTPPSEVDTMVGDSSAKSVRVTTDTEGRLGFDFLVNAFPGTAWKLTLTAVGATNPRYERAGLTDHHGRGHDGGTIAFDGTNA